MSQMLPQDMMAALQGGGGGGGLPPDIGAMIGGGAPAGGGPAPQTANPAGAEQAAGETPLPGVTDGSPGGGSDALVAAINAIQDAIDAESDQEDVQIMLQCQAKLQSILAKEQSEQDSALQGKATPKGTRKMAAQGGY